MTDTDARLQRLEERQAATHQRLTTLEREVEILNALPVAVARLEGGLVDVRDDVRDLCTAMAAIRLSIDDRELQTSEERRSLRIALIALSGVILAALIAAAATIVAASLGS